MVLQNKYSSQWRNTKEEIVTPKGLEEEIQEKRAILEHKMTK